MENDNECKRILNEKILDSSEGTAKPRPDDIVPPTVPATKGIGETEDND